MTSRLAVKHATSGCAKSWPVCVIAAEMRQVSERPGCSFASAVYLRSKRHTFLVQIKWCLGQAIAG